MQINLKNGSNNDTVYATVRMNKEEYVALREYMHTKEGADIGFPYGSVIVKHGYGWYRLLPLTAQRGIDKVLFAIKVLRRFIKDQEAKLAEEIKRYVPLMLDPALKIATFSTAHSEGEFGYLGTPQPPQPASSEVLQRLATVINSRRH